MSKKAPEYLNIEECVDHIVDMFGDDISIGMPLGLGKPVGLINALYQRAKSNSQINLNIYTALSLEKPIPASDLEERLMGPFIDRTFNGVPDLDYQVDLRTTGLPENVQIYEVYSKAGAIKGVDMLQKNHVSSNYTHSVRDINSNGNCIFGHLITKSKTENGVLYSASCNSDTSLETIKDFKAEQAKGNKKLIIGMVNTKLPFMYGDAVLTADSYDIIIDDPDHYLPLFAAPRAPVSVPDFMIGLHTSTLIKDNGTLQIGIGALGDSVAYGLNVRHNENTAYKKLIADSGIGERYKESIEGIGGTDKFEDGLYGSTEMLVDGFLQLYKNGIIKRKVYHHIGIQKLINDGKLKETEIPKDVLKLMLEDETLHPYLTQKDFDGLQRFGVFREGVAYDNGEILDGNTRYSALLADDANLADISENCLGNTLKNGVMLTGGFFLGPQDFYDDLNNMSDEERMQFEMTGVDVANQLYGDEELRRLQRKNGRFCNTGMKATLLGAICSDGLEDGTVVSGVGGQYNFVSMAHALSDGRCLMMIKSTRMEGAKVLSNIVYNYGHTTIPRHLRDIVVTEYGIADIRGKCDQEIIKEMLNITDSRFQDELMAEAKKNKKLSEDYQIPEEFRNNTPEKLVQILAGPKAEGLFPDFPCGSPMTPEELFLAFAMKTLKAKSQTPEAAKFPAMMGKLPTEVPENILPLVARMGLESPASKEEVISQKTLMLALKLAGFF